MAAVIDSSYRQVRGASFDGGDVVTLSAGNRGDFREPTWEGLTTGFRVVAAVAAGDLDPTFGVGGLVTTDFGSWHDIVHSIAVQDDGKILVAGYSPQGGTNEDFALARYL